MVTNADSNVKNVLNCSNVSGINISHVGSITTWRTSSFYFCLPQVIFGSWFTHSWALHQHPNPHLCSVQHFGASLWQFICWELEEGKWTYVACPCESIHYIASLSNFQVCISRPSSLVKTSFDVYMLTTFKWPAHLLGYLGKPYQIQFRLFQFVFSLEVNISCYFLLLPQKPWHWRTHVQDHRIWCFSQAIPASGFNFTLQKVY